MKERKLLKKIMSSRSTLIPAFLPLFDFVAVGFLYSLISGPTLGWFESTICGFAFLAVVFVTTSTMKNRKYVLVFVSAVYWLVISFVPVNIADFSTASWFSALEQGGFLLLIWMSYLISEYTLKDWRCGISLLLILLFVVEIGLLYLNIRIMLLFERELYWYMAVVGLLSASACFDKIYSSKRNIFKKVALSIIAAAAGGVIGLYEKGVSLENIFCEARYTPSFISAVLRTALHNAKLWGGIGVTNLEQFAFTNVLSKYGVLPATLIILNLICLSIYMFCKAVETKNTLCILGASAIAICFFTAIAINLDMLPMMSVYTPFLDKNLWVLSYGAYAFYLFGFEKIKRKEYLNCPIAPF